MTLNSKWRSVIPTIVVVVCHAAGALGGDETKDVVFRAAVDGTEQRYVMIVPESFSKSTTRRALVALHGHGSDRWQFAKNERAECRAARDVARERGMLFVSPDYRAKTSWMGPKAEADVAQIIEEIRKAHGVEKVVLCGGSMGGTGALTFTALRPDLVDGVVSLNGTANLVEYERFLDAIAESFGGAKDRVPEEYRKRSAEFFPEKFAMPFAATTGGKDTIVPPDSVHRLIEKVREKNKNVLLIHRPNGGHDTNYDDSRTAIEFVVKLLSNER